MEPIPKKSSAGVLFAAFVCIEIFFVAATVSGPVWREIFGLTNTQLGLCLGAAGGGVLISSLFAGHATHRQGPLRVLLFSLTVILFALVAVAAAKSFVMLFAGLIAVGVCVAASHNAATTILTGIFPFRVRQIMSLASALWFGSSVLSAPLIGYWLDFSGTRGWQSWGFRVPFVWLIFMIAVCLMLIKLRFRWLNKDFFKEKPDENQHGMLSGRGREWVWVLALGFCHGMMIVSLLAWLNPMAQDVLGVSDFLGSLLFGVGALGLAAGRLFIALWHDKIWRDDRAVLALSGTLGALLFAGALAAPDYKMTFIFTGAGAFACSATAPCLFSIVSGRFPRIRSQLYGYMEASIAAAAIAGSFLVGFLSDLGVPLSAAMGLSPLAALALGGIAMAWKIKRPFSDDVCRVENCRQV